MRRLYVLFVALILHHAVWAYPSDHSLPRHDDDVISGPERDNEASKKIIGSSVVTSVSVILNGDEPEFQDAIGNKVAKPAAPIVASPINLLNPDRYEFYTFDENGELVKRLMTLQEIQSIVANGDGESPAIIHSIAIDSRDPEKNVRDIVASVQNVLTKEVEEQKNSSDIAPVLDTPDVSSSWSMILPAIFGNTGGDIFPQTKPQQVVMVPDSDVVETTTKAQRPRPRPRPKPSKNKPSNKRRTTTKKPSTDEDIESADNSNKKRPTEEGITLQKPLHQKGNGTSSNKHKKKKPRPTTIPPMLQTEEIPELESPKPVTQEQPKTTTSAPEITTIQIPQAILETTITPLINIEREPATTAAIIPTTTPLAEFEEESTTPLLVTKSPGASMSPLAITNILNSLKGTDDDLSTKMSFDQIMQSLKDELAKEETTEPIRESEPTTTALPSPNIEVEITQEKLVEAEKLEELLEATTVTPEESNENESNAHVVKFEPLYADVQEPLITEITTEQASTEAPISEFTTSVFEETTTNANEVEVSTVGNDPEDAEITSHSSVLSQEVAALISKHSEQLPSVDINTDRLSETLAHHEIDPSMSMAEFQKQIATLASNSEDIVPTTADTPIDSGETKNEIEFLMSDVINQMTDELPSSTTVSSKMDDAHSITNRLSSFAQISTAMLDSMKPSIEALALQKENLREESPTTPTYKEETTTAVSVLEEEETGEEEEEEEEEATTSTTTETYTEALATTLKFEDESTTTESTDSADSSENSEDIHVGSQEAMDITTTGSPVRDTESSTDISGETAVVLTDSDMEDSSSEQAGYSYSTTEAPEGPEEEELVTEEEAEVEAEASTFAPTTPAPTTTTTSTRKPISTLKPVTHFQPHESKPVAYSANQQRPLVRPANLSNLKIAFNTATRPPVILEPTPVDSQGLSASTNGLEEDIQEFARLCNELAFAYWKAITSEKISAARSLVISPFALTSMLSMVFLGARGGTSGEMNEVLKLDDMVTFNPHLVFKNITDSVEKATDSDIASTAFVREIFSDRGNGRVLQFFKEKTQQLYSGHVEEVNFNVVNDIIRRRTNLLVKRHTMGKVLEYLRTNSVWVNGPLATISANLFQTECSRASTADRDGEMFFQVPPSIRQRRLVPIPAIVYKSGFTAGYYPGLDATVVAFGRPTETVSTIYVMPGQQGTIAPGDHLGRLESTLVETAFTKGSWNQLLSTLMDRPGLEVQLPRFSHRSFINASLGLQKMGLKGLFNSDFADLRGLTGSSNKDVYLSDMIQINTFSTCAEQKIGDHHHVEMYPAPPIRKRNKDVDEDNEFDSSESVIDFGSIAQKESARGFYDDLLDPKYLELPLPLRPRQARIPDAPRLRFDKPFLYFVRHNPTGMILYMGRFNPRLLP